MTAQANNLRAKTAWIQCIIFLGIWLAFLFLFHIPLFILIEFSAIPAPDFNSNSANATDLTFVTLSQLCSTLGVVAAVYLMRKTLEKEVVAFPWLKINYKSFLQGFLLAFAMIGSTVAILYFSGWVDFSFQALSVDLLTYLGLFMLVAIHEEILCRGYLLDTLHKAYGKYVGVFVSTFIFASLHIFNDHVGWIGLSNIFLSGLLMALFVLWQKNLWAAIGIHFAWNYFQGPVFGFAVSGMSAASLLEVEHMGSSILTGSDFGLEGSLIALTILAATTLFMVWMHHKQPALIPEKRAIPEVREL